MSRGSRLSSKARLGLQALPLFAWLAMLPILGHLGLDRTLEDAIGPSAARGLAFSILAVCFLLPFVAWFRHSRYIASVVREIRERGEPADAVISEIRQTGAKKTDGVDESWRVEMVLDVNRPGGEAYRASTWHWVSVLEIPQYQPGKSIPVKVNPANRDEVVVDAGPMP